MSAAGHSDPAFALAAAALEPPAQAGAVDPPKSEVDDLLTSRRQVQELQLTAAVVVKRLCRNKHKYHTAIMD